MKVLQIAVKIFGLLFGAESLWYTMLFPKRDELDESPEDKINQFLFILRPLFAAVSFFLVWQLIARGPDTFVKLTAGQPALNSVARFVQWPFDFIHSLLQACDTWICETFWPIQFLFPSDLLFRVSGIGIYIACYRMVKKPVSGILLETGKKFLETYPVARGGMEKIYLTNEATGKVMLSPKWKRVKRILSVIITANFLLVYVLNVLTGFATTLLRSFLPINVVTFAGFFGFMEAYHFLGLEDVPQNRCRLDAELSLPRLLTNYKLYAEEKGIPIECRYRKSGEFAEEEAPYSSGYEGAEDPKIAFLYQYLQERNQTECMDTAVRLLEGNSVFYASPFYRDVDGCIFFLMFMSLLRQEKGLILTEDGDGLEDLAQWMRAGLDTLSGLGQLWTVAVLQDAGENADVGILPFQACPGLLAGDLGIFLEQVSFAVVLESSNMLMGGQELILSLAERISVKTAGCTWLLCDWNAESVADLFSHLLKIELTCVGATPAGARESVVSYWNTESEPEYIWPSAKRFLGLEAGISAVAEENKVSRVSWYGADCMPVADVSWIIAQYARASGGQASRSAGQDRQPMQIQYRVSAISDSAAPESFLIVEDTCCSLFETARQYVTRGRDKVYVHVLSPNYMLRDFMKCRAEEIEDDPKYLAQLVPEYVNSARNVYLHLLRRLLAEEVPEKDIYDQLSRCEEPPEFVKCPLSEFYVKDAVREMVKTVLGVGIDVNRDIQTRSRTVFSEEGACTAQGLWCRIVGKEVRRAFLKYFRQARYVDENGRARPISRLMLAGHLELKYLPGQFVTMRGKYYQVEHLLDSESEMLLSPVRASDRLRGRWFYRQLRTYTAEGPPGPGAETLVFSRHGVFLTRVSLDFTAETIGYTALEKGWDKCSEADGYPYRGTPRSYFKKQVLRVDVPVDKVGKDSFLYFAAMIHDMFYTLFPQYNYLLSVAVDLDEGEREFYSRYRGVLSQVTFTGKERPESPEEDNEPEEDRRSFYIFEDSCEDMGLLRSIERHFPRILRLAAEYVEWEGRENRSYFS